MMPDPLILADEALLNLNRIRSSLRSLSALALLERTEEIVRRLGWGPDDEPAKPTPQPDREFAGWDGAWRRGAR